MINLSEQRDMMKRKRVRLMMIIKDGEEEEGDEEQR